MLECRGRIQEKGGAALEDNSREKAIREIRQAVAEGKDDVLWKAYEIAMECAWIGDEETCMEIIAMIA